MEIFSLDWHNSEQLLGTLEKYGLHRMKSEYTRRTEHIHIWRKAKMEQKLTLNRKYEDSELGWAYFRGENKMKKFHVRHCKGGRGLLKDALEF